MLPLALAVSVSIAVDALDWSTASDDLRFASLKPVMTEAEVKRLFAGKKCDVIGCGSGTDKNGNTIPGCDLGYRYNLADREEPLGIRFKLIGRVVKGAEPDPWVVGRGHPWGEPPPPVKRVEWTIVSFEVEGGATYTRNKYGSLVAQPMKK